MFTLRYNFKKKDEIFNLLKGISQIKIEDWDLKFDKGRLELFYTFPEIKPHLSINNNRFEIFASDEEIKVNFPAEDFFHMKGPRGITRIANYPDEDAKKPFTLEELEDLREKLNLIFVAKLGLMQESEIESVELIFSTELPKKVDFSKLSQNIESESGKIYEIGRLELIIKDNENKRCIIKQKVN